MAYLVRTLPPAEADAERIYDWVISRAPHRGPMWFNGLEAAVASLAENPQRCHRAPEAKEFDEDIRQLLYGKRHGTYRILFRIDESAKRVDILHIRHGSQEHLRRP